MMLLLYADPFQGPLCHCMPVRVLPLGWAPHVWLRLERIAVLPP